MDSSIYLPIERLRYWEGQVLRSRDFNDQAALDAQMRWWHNRALHRAFGTRLGLVTSPITRPADNALVGVRVSEGIAYDCFGRELVLCPGQDIALPESPNVDKLFLLLRRMQTGGVTIRAECAPPSCRTARHEAELVWRLPGQCEVSDGVPLARISVVNQVPQLDPFPTRPVSHPLARPRVATGTLVSGRIVWEEFSLIAKIAAGMQTRVDTTAAGFTQTPAYFAWLAIMPDGSRDELSALELLSLPTDIIQGTSVGFTFRILTRSILEGNEEDEEKPKSSFTLRARKLGLSLCWLGCEHMPEAPICRDECDCQCAGKLEREASGAEKENHHAH